MLLLSRPGTNLAVLLSFMGLMVTVYSKPPCSRGCRFTRTYNPPSFRHVSDLQNSSVAPWSLEMEEQERREPYGIQYAECKKCIYNDMVAKPIYIQISVYERIESDTSVDGNAWCRCPYKLAVGCTCVMEVQQ